MSLFVCLMLPLVCSLGAWQLERAAYKRDLTERYLAKVGGLPQTPGNSRAEPFERLRLVGRFGPEQWLLDNKTHNGVAGYWVLQSFLSTNASYVVNRGWVQAPSVRAELPQVETPPQELSLVVVRWPETGLQPLWDEDVWAAGWPKRIQAFDLARMRRDRANLEPYEMRLEAGSVGVFEPASTALDFRPERHMGYAVQWFGLGGVLVIGYAVLIWRERRDIEEQL